MSLTKKDLQNIAGVVQKEIKATVPGMIEAGIKNTVPGMIRDELKPIKEDIAQIRKDIKTITNFFDREYLELRNRVERIEEHLHLPLS